MNKKVRIIATTLMLTGSLVSVVPANAAIKTDIVKPTGDIIVASYSKHSPRPGYHGKLWCTGDGVYIRDVSGNRIPDGEGGYLHADRGDRFYCDYVSNGKCYFTSWTGQKAYISASYASTVAVN